MAAPKLLPPNTHQNEVNFAYMLLKFLHANISNPYLLLAIIAWVRSESGHKYIGNNPLNLRPGKDDARFRSGIRKGRVGSFSVYRSLTAGAQATANRLLRLSGLYGTVVKALQNTATGNKAMDKQATDFLTAIALSKWDAGHYGLAIIGLIPGRKGTRPHKGIIGWRDWTHNSLLKVYASLTGHAFKYPTETQPGKTTTTRKGTSHKVIPEEKHHHPAANFLDGYEAFHFLEVKYPRGGGTLDQ